MRRNLSLIVGAALVSLLVCVSPSLAEVTIRQKPVEVEYKTFDPKSDETQRELKLTGEEAAVTHFKFDCQARLSYEEGRQMSAGGTVLQSMRIHDVDVDLALQITVWLPNGASDSVRAHEEAHRRIGESYYEHAEEAARAIAEKLDGKSITLKIIDKKSDASRLADAADQVNKEYGEAIPDRAQRANAIFDDLTRHGNSRTMTPDKARPKAIKTEEREWAEKHPPQAKKTAAAKGPTAPGPARSSKK